MKKISSLSAQFLMGYVTVVLQQEGTWLIAKSIFVEKSNT